MALFVVAIQSKYNCYRKLRVVDTTTNSVVDFDSAELYRKMTFGLPNERIRIENMRVKPYSDTFEFIACDESRMCHLKDDMTARVNADGLILCGIDGEYVYIANWKGQILRIHMLIVAKNIWNKTYVLCNGVVAQTGWISFMQDKYGRKVE